MKIKVDACWSGGNRYHFRCTMPDGTRFNVGHNSDGDNWCRKFATEMRDHLVQNYGVKRNSVKVI